MNKQKKFINYKEQIKSPFWQRRRLEIMQKDDFTCQMCGDKTKQLNVHHLHYDSTRDYWDYQDWELITLCEDCHSVEHGVSESEIISQISEIKGMGITNFEIYNAIIEMKWALEYGDFFTDINTESEKLKRLSIRHLKLKNL